MMRDYDLISSDQNTDHPAYERQLVLGKAKTAIENAMEEISAIMKRDRTEVK